MRILGIDPGSVATGWGVVERRGAAVVHVEHGVVRPARDASLALRLAVIHRELCAIIDRLEPGEAAIERVFVARNPHSALVLGQARGAAMAALGMAGVEVFEVAAREVKQVVTGSGRAGKEQIQAQVTGQLTLGEPPPSDAADALAVAICAAHRGRLAERVGARASRTAGRNRRALWTDWVERRTR